MILIQQTWPTIRDLDRPARLTEIMDHHFETAPIITPKSQSIPSLTIAPRPARQARQTVLGAPAIKTPQQIGRTIESESPALRNALYGRPIKAPSPPTHSPPAAAPMLNALAPIRDGHMLTVQEVDSLGHN